jgi:DNA adenine methylase
MKSPLRYPGGKSKAVKHLLGYLPAGLQEMCSPFLGGGSFELACAARGIKVYAYDNFYPLVNFWKCLLEDPAYIRNMLLHRYYPINKDYFKFLQKSYEQTNESDPYTYKTFYNAAIFYALNRCSFSGTIFSGGFSPGHPRFTKKVINELANFKICNFYIGYADFSESIKSHPDRFLYCDPPYFTRRKNLYGRHGNNHKYFEHEKLASLLKARDNWMLSYNNCPEILELYQGYRIEYPAWSYGLGNNRQSREVLIFSHDRG